ncbi:MAG: ABC transporter permease [Phycisphaerales bacterium]|nr:ABC transporter permease [Phycisphaerales bacterium]
MRLLKKLIVVQEFGLVAVIGLMMAGLWYFTPAIPRRERVDLAPADAVAATSSGIAVTREHGGKENFSSAKGWRLVERGSIRRLERKERIEVPKGATVTEVAEMTVTVGGPFTKQVQSGYRVSGAGRLDGGYPTGDGHHWQSYAEDDGTIVLERDPHVNKFLNADNLMIVATSASFYGIMAVGLTAIIVLGGIDLSVGAIYALASVVGATVLKKASGGGVDGAGVGTATALLIGFGVCGLVGALCGLINGAASVGLRVHPFIITLGGMGVYRGVAYLVSKGQSISDFPEGFGSFVRMNILGVEPLPLIAMLAVGLGGSLVFARTVFGRHVFATGGNEVAARYAGIAVGRTKVIVFTIAGLLAGLAAAIAIGKYGAASSQDGSGYELEVIAAAVVGGASLSGGRGSALGAVLGAIVIQLINNGFEALAIDQAYKQIVIGMAIVLAVVVDQLKTRLSNGAGKR